MRKLIRLLLILAFFAAILGLGWLRRPDITPQLIEELETTALQEPVFKTDALPSETTEEGASRPHFWPEPLEDTPAAEAIKEDGLPDCNVTNYEYDADQTLKGNIGNLKDATVNCKVRVGKKTP